MCTRIRFGRAWQRFRKLRVTLGLRGVRRGTDAVRAAALLDRLLHRCHIVNIRGNSYRMRRHAELSKAIHPLASRIDADSQASGQGQS